MNTVFASFVLFTLNSFREALYVEIFERLHEAVPRKKGLNFCPEIGFSAMTVLQLTGRSLSSSFSVQKSITEMKHPACNLNLAPNDVGARIS